MTMKRIFIILLLFGTILNSFAQTTIKRDIVKADDELYVRDSTILEVIDANAPSGTAREAANGLHIDGNNVVLGDTLDRETTISGASYNFYLGQVLSKILNLYINVSDDFVVNADDNIEFSSNGISYIWDGTYWINQSTNDTLATKSDVETLVDAATYNASQLHYNYSTSTTDSRPGSGLFRLNNATPSSVTQIYVDDEDINAFNQSNTIALIDTGSYWLLYESNSIYANYKLTGGYTAASGYTKLNVAHQSGSGVFTSGATIKHTLDLSQDASLTRGIDSLYNEDSEEWLTNGDTITVDSVAYANIAGFASDADSANHADTATYASSAPLDSVYSELTAEDTLRFNYAKNISGDLTIESDSDADIIADSINLAANALSFGNTVIDTTSISVDTTKTTVIEGDNLYLNLGTTRKAGAFYRGSVTPTSLDTLRYDGDLFLSNLHTASYMRAGYSTTNMQLASNFLIGSVSGVGRLILTPAVADGPAAIGYRFDTENDITSGSLLDIRKQGVTLYDFTDDTLDAPNINANFNGLSIGGGDLLESTNTIVLKDAVEAESFSHIQLENETYSTHSKGRVYLDSATGGLILDDDINGKWNLSSEVGERYYNPTGSQIDNGKVVRLTGSHEVNGVVYGEIALAGNSTVDSTLVLGMATTDIPATGYGRVTFLGRLNDLNTTGITGQFYLGKSGNILDVSPTPSDLSVPLGQVIKTDNDSGSVVFNPRMPEYNPSPIFSLDTFDLDEAVTINTQNVYEYIPIGSINIPDNNFGFTFTGDSIQIDVAGYYQIVLSMSFQGNPTSETWNYGVFKNNDLQHKKTRTTSSSVEGDVNVPVSRQLSVDDWISFRIRNTSGTGDPTVVDLAIQILFLHL